MIQAGGVLGRDFQLHRALSQTQGLQRRTRRCGASLYHGLQRRQQSARSAAKPARASRAAGLLAMLNTDDPALTDLDLGQEYGAVAAAYEWGFDEMVVLAKDGVDATWLDDGGKAVLHGAAGHGVEDSRRTPI